MGNTRVKTSLYKKANILLKVMTVDKILAVIINKSWLTLDVMQYQQHESKLYYYAIHCYVETHSVVLQPEHCNGS
jgi:hypothetical protein